MNNKCDIRSGKIEVEKATNESSILRYVSKKITIRGIEPNFRIHWNFGRFATKETSIFKKLEGIMSLG